MKDYTISEEAAACLSEVGDCCTWTIRVSSEDCEISISGVSVVLSDWDEANTGIKVYYHSAGPYFCLSEAIIEARDNWRADCGGGE